MLRDHFRCDLLVDMSNAVKMRVIPLVDFADDASIVWSLVRAAYNRSI